MNGRLGAVVTILVTAAVNIANLYGYNIDADAAVKAALTVGSAVSIVWSWWRNNDLTEEAFIGTGLTRALKAKKKHSETFEAEPDNDPEKSEAKERSK